MQSFSPAPLRYRYPGNTTALLLIVATLALTGCAGQRAAPTAPRDAEVPRGPWFCEPAPDVGWDCTSDPTVVSNPVPGRSRSLVSALYAQQTAADPAPQTSTVVKDWTKPGDVAGASTPLRTGPDQSNLTTDKANDLGNPTGGAVTTTAPQPLRSSAADPEASVSDEPARRAEQPTALLDLPPNYYAVQVLAMSSPDSLQRYFDELGLETLSAAEIAVNGEFRYVLLLGVYEDFVTAQKAATELPEALKGKTPWIRQVGNLQAAMRRAKRLREN